ncbi:MAG: HD domain-containing protein, partial [Alphaproteobacteria bacterium]|nr:HD domain-containing protein [Alphaproteobacteria bacterium]
GEYRDNETGAHVIRVAKSCGLLARALGQDVDWAEMLMNASPLHDVGKIGVPDAILLKPGKLEPAEFERMKKHVEIGADIVPEGKSALLDMGRRVVLTHHEKWNGTGYPAGLKGEGIPLEGRIAAICDVFDALTSARPYKPAWPVDEALDLLKAQAGQQFDPRVVEAFLTIVPEVVALRTQFSDDNEAEKVRA